MLQHRNTINWNINNEHMNGNIFKLKQIQILLH